MKTIVLFALVACVAAQEFYTSIPDGLLDAEAVAGDREKLKEYMDCYLDKKPCADLAGRLKKLIPDAIENACKKCTSKQKHFAARYIQAAKLVIPREYEELKAKYDPENKYFDTFEDEVFKYIDLERSIPY